MNYRLLEHDEVIQSGDEFLEDDAKTWTEITDKSPCSWTIGMKWKGRGLKPMRRKVQNNN
ncbi:hypothetical protein [Pseudoalteromonas piratica]|nr:hypothetical protein [Pseudoalteromonas piratica]